MEEGYLSRKAQNGGSIARQTSGVGRDVQSELDLLGLDPHLLCPLDSPDR